MGTDYFVILRLLSHDQRKFVVVVFSFLSVQVKSYIFELESNLSLKGGTSTGQVFGGQKSNQLQRLQHFPTGQLSLSKLHPQKVRLSATNRLRLLYQAEDIYCMDSKHFVVTSHFDTKNM